MSGARRAPAYIVRLFRAAKIDASRRAQFHVAALSDVAACDNARDETTLRAARTAAMAATAPGDRAAGGNGDAAGGSGDGPAAGGGAVEVDGADASPGVQSALKRAKKALRNGEYENALDRARDALKADRRNYFALVFVGAAAAGLGERARALQAYERAVAVDERAALAWRGVLDLVAGDPRRDSLHESRCAIRACDALLAQSKAVPDAGTPTKTDTASRAHADAADGQVAGGDDDTAARLLERRWLHLSALVQNAPDSRAARDGNGGNAGDGGSDDGDAGDVAHITADDVHKTVAGVHAAVSPKTAAPATANDTVKDDATAARRRVIDRLRALAKSPALHATAARQAVLQELDAYSSCAGGSTDAAAAAATAPAAFAAQVLLRRRVSFAQCLFPYVECEATRRYRHAPLHALTTFLSLLEEDSAPVYANARHLLLCQQVVRRAPHDSEVTSVARAFLIAQLVFNGPLRRRGGGENGASAASATSRARADVDAHSADALIGSLSLTRSPSESLAAIGARIWRGEWRAATAFADKAAETVRASAAQGRSLRTCGAAASLARGVACAARDEHTSAAAAFRDAIDTLQRCVGVHGGDIEGDGAVSRAAQLQRCALRQLAASLHSSGEVNEALVTLRRIVQCDAGDIWARTHLIAWRRARSASSSAGSSSESVSAAAPSSTSISSPRSTAAPAEFISRDPRQELESLLDTVASPSSAPYAPAPELVLLAAPSTFDNAAATRAAFFLQLGRERAATSEQEAAREAYLSAIAADPSNVHAYTALGESLVTLDRDRAVRCFERACRLEPNHTRACTQLLRLYASIIAECDENGDPAGVRGAARSMERVCVAAVSRTSTGVSWAWRTLGTLYLESDRCAAAISALHACMRDSEADGGDDRSAGAGADAGGDGDMDLWYKLGVAYQRTGKVTSACTALERAHAAWDRRHRATADDDSECLAMAPLVSGSRVCVALGKLLADLGRHERAVRILTTMLERVRKCSPPPPRPSPARPAKLEGCLGLVLAYTHLMQCEQERQLGKWTGAFFAVRRAADVLMAAYSHMPESNELADRIGKAFLCLATDCRAGHDMHETARQLGDSAPSEPSGHRIKSVQVNALNSARMWFERLEHRNRDQGRTEAGAAATAHRAMAEFLSADLAEKQEATTAAAALQSVSNRKVRALRDMADAARRAPDNRTTWTFLLSAMAVCGMLSAEDIMSRNLLQWVNANAANTILALALIDYDLVHAGAHALRDEGNNGRSDGDDDDGTSINDDTEAHARRTRRRVVTNAVRALEANVNASKSGSALLGLVCEHVLHDRESAFRAYDMASTHRNDDEISSFHASRMFLSAEDAQASGTGEVMGESPGTTARHVAFLIRALSSIDMALTPGGDPWQAIISGTGSIGNNGGGGGGGGDGSRHSQSGAVVGGQITRAASEAESEEEGMRDRRAMSMLLQRVRAVHRSMASTRDAIAGADLRRVPPDDTSATLRWIHRYPDLLWRSRDQHSLLKHVLRQQQTQTQARE